MADKKRSWEDAMGEMFAPDRYGTAAEFTAPAPIASDFPLPRAGVENRGPGRPEFRGDVDVGPLELSGSYQKRFDNARPEWKAMLNYRRSF